MDENMGIDSPSDSQPLLRSRDRIVRRLARFGVPKEQLDQPGLVAFVKEKRELKPDLVNVILSVMEEAEAVQDSKSGLRKMFLESLVWLQWLMFEGDPNAALGGLSIMSVGQRGVCGAVWGRTDIAYRCRTCEHDPTCAICVPCFENGDHKGHDYFVIYTGGGCCDCGDVTAWKREGFCSMHKGAEQVKPLPEEIANTVAPVLGSLFDYWKGKLTIASDSVSKRKKAANDLTFSVVDMLLEFCKHSESLLSYVARLLFSSTGLLGIMVRAERFLSNDVVKKLHELLLKLLGEPTFKYEFAKVFLTYYPSIINEAIKECSDLPLKRYPLLSMFSVQILTVPTLTPRLVKEINLLTMLLECLENIFISCAEDGHLQVSRWVNLYETTIRVIEDIRFVMSHVVVPKFITNDQQDISRTWMRLLSYVQGMSPQKRETGQHIEEENENVHLPFVLGNFVANIHALLVEGAFSDATKGEMDDELVSSSNNNETDNETDYGDVRRHTKVGRLSEESSACNVTIRNNALACPKVFDTKSDTTSHLFLPQSATWLVYECLRAIENCFGVENTPGMLPNMLSQNSGTDYNDNFSAFKRTMSNFRRGTHSFGRFASSGRDHGKQCSDDYADSLEIGKSAVKDGTFRINDEIDSENTCTSSNLDDSAMEEDFPVVSDGLRFLSSPDWPLIVYDVSSQDISVHIPLHRLISMLLQKALRRCFCESDVPDVSSDNSLEIYSDFFGYALRGSHPYGFSAFVMEHPLRIRVFCAQVHAGMWRKNGDAALLSCEWYKSVRWSEPGMELDLFLLQCCAALAPEDLYVSRILERFGLSNYVSLNLEQSNEHEPVLVQEMLTLIIQIVKERRFCGLTTAESLKRELIYKLSIGDATHSQLLKSLPRDLSKFEQLQGILDTVAIYSNPSGFNQGMYSLRWPYWKELDLYHSRWNSKDLQVAEERYLRFCSVSALTTQLPRWTKIYPPLKGIARIATCKVVLQIIRAVLFYAVVTFKSAESRAPDGVLLPALHLLALSLDICFQQKESSENLCHDVAQIPIIAFAGEIIDGSSFYGVGNQSLLSLLVLLMEMHRKDNVDNIVDAGGCSLSSLIESILKKFAEIDDGCMTELQKLAPEVVNHISECVPARNSSASLSSSDSEKRKAKARERQAAIMEKMRSQQTKFLASVDPTVDDGSQLDHEGDLDSEHDSEESKQVVCSLCHDPNSRHPISYLILLQKSRLVSSVDRGPVSWAQLCQSDKKLTPIINTKETNMSMNMNSGGSESTSSSHITRIVQSAASELSSGGQPGEVNAFLKYVKNQFPALGNFQLPDTSYDEIEKTPYTFETLEQGMYFSIREEMHDLILPSNLMNGDENVQTAGGNSDAIKNTGSVLLGKYTADLVRERSEISSASENSSSENDSVESTSQHPANGGFSPIDCDGVHLSSCGHAVHQECLSRYLSSLKERSVRRIVFEGGHIVDPDQGEFLCPVCRRLVNCVLPTLPGELRKPIKQSIVLNGSMHTTSPLAGSSNMTYSLRLQQAMKLLQSAANALGNDKFLKAIPLNHIDRTRPNLENFSWVLSKMYFPGKQDKLSRFSRRNHSMLMWDTLKYSLTSMEIAARCGKTSLTPNFALSSMYEELKSASGFILSLLLKLVQKTRSKNSLHVLQRFLGLQSFAESICSGVSLYANNDVPGIGDKLSIMKSIEMDLSNTDLHFWSQASGPVLSHDPFSSLMWVLFCLPHPLLSCEESLLSLVHVFYIVAVTQAIVLYYQQSKDKSSSASALSDDLINDIYRVLGESGYAQQYFVSNYFDPSIDIKDAIRRFSFPFLRRCALLWKILYSSIPAPFCGEENLLDRLWNTPKDTMDRINIDMFEATKIQELENMFQIPSLDVVLKDELSRSSVLIWCRHFCKEFESQRFKYNMHVTPVVPFELMRLPNVYQNLLQRCIKQRCPECKSLLDEPALCLLCGRLCSPSWKSCCRESGCQTHAITCGAGTGVFLLIRRTTVLLQRSARQAPWPSPYLDCFGEEDFEMNRGKPLYLNEERYAALTYMVASHGLDRSSKVLGQTTIGSFFLV